MPLVTIKSVLSVCVYELAGGVCDPGHGYIDDIWTYRHTPERDYRGVQSGVQSVHKILMGSLWFFRLYAQRTPTVYSWESIPIGRTCLQDLSIWCPSSEGSAMDSQVWEAGGTLMLRQFHLIAKSYTYTPPQIRSDKHNYAFFNMMPQACLPIICEHALMWLWLILEKLVFQCMCIYHSLYNNDFFCAERLANIRIRLCPTHECHDTIYCAIW